MIIFESINAEDLLADAVWWQIYEQSFPAHERETAAVIATSLESGVGVAMRVCVDDITCGLATLHLLREPAAVFLVYLAIAEQWRSRGIGGQLFAAAWEEGKARLCAEGREPIGMVWEVDPALGDGGRRSDFFRRQSGLVLKRSYWQPPVDGKQPVSMQLMFAPGVGDALPADFLTDSLVRAIYFEKYHAINHIDAVCLEELFTRGRDR